MGKDLQTVQQYYADRMAIQYRGKPKASAEINLLAGAATGDMFIQDVQDAFDVTTAVGPQLDILGKYIGLSRQVPETLSRPFFGFVEYDGSSTNTNGFQDYGSLPILGTWGTAIASPPVSAIGSNPANLSQIVAAGHGSPSQLGYSTDNGATWTQVTVPGGWAFSGQGPASVCCGNGFWVVTGIDSAWNVRVAYCPVSNLTAWASLTLGIATTSGGLGACCFAQDLGIFCLFATMATGYASSFTCTNPATWTGHTTALSASGQYGGIARGGGLFVAILYYDTYVSTDGATWVYHHSTFTNGAAITYADSQSKFVLVADSGVTSADGVLWSAISTPRFPLQQG